MTDEEIKGRNLVQRGRFPSDWKTFWTHDGVGNAVVSTDPLYDYYLMMNRLAKVTQVIETPVFTPAQMTGVVFRIAFVYENYHDGGNSKVVLTTTSGKVTPIDLSGKIPEQPQADWNPFPYLTIEGMTSADRDLTVDLHGSDLAGSSGLRITDIDVDVRLVPLVLEKIQLDDRVYEP